MTAPAELSSTNPLLNIPLLDILLLDIPPFVVPAQDSERMAVDSLTETSQ